ncbi:MAG: DUF5011 domain-containing protein [Chitinophagales bacterium]|nr:DUF5011 domain-containing protein [Bacteroidota bacterium]MCB9043726.1 DUF5011 domain-containing protein [Chitinophagales bacterium]
MKKTLFTLAMMGIGFGAYAQQAQQNLNPHHKAVKEKPAIDNVLVSSNAKPYVATNTKVAAPGVKIGETTYDLQTNQSVDNRIVNPGDGRILAAWTYDFNFSDAAPDRGTGFNERDAAGNWGSIPTGRLEDQRVGWPSIGETASGRVFSITHTGGAGLLFTYRDAGETAWSSKPLTDADGNNLDATAVWSRAAVVGNTIHVMCSRLGDVIYGVDGGLNYFRSDDAGETWISMQLPNMDDQHFSFFGGDAYAIAANGDDVAIVANTYGPVIWRSTDGGENWTFTILVENSNLLYNPAGGDILLDPVLTTDGAFDALIDNNGVLHVWYGSRVWMDDDGAGASYYPSTGQGIMYWNENMMGQPDIIANTILEDYTGDCQPTYEATPQHRNGLVSMPSAGIDADGNLYLTYSAVVDGAIDEESEPYRDVFAVKSMDGGNTWIGPINLTNSPTQDCIYASLARNVDDNLHLVYQADDLTGSLLFTTQAQATVNDIMYLEVPVGDIVTPDPTSNTCPQLFRLYNLNAKVDCAVDLENAIIFNVDYPDGNLNEQYLENAGNILYTTPNSTEEVYVTVTDSDGNSAIDTVTINVLAADVEPPVMELIGSDNMAILVNTPWNDPGVLVADAYDGLGCPASDYLTIDGMVDNTTIGVYTLTYNASDNAGNMATSLSRTVNVIAEDSEGPQIILADGDNVTVNGQFGVAFPAPEFQVIDNIDGDITNTDQVTVTGVEDVNLEVLGSYTITYTATDSFGNTTTVIQTINVVDTTPPVIVLSGGGTLIHTCDTEFTEPGYSAIDEFDGNLTSLVEIAGFVCITDPATYTLTYTVSDNSGNQGVATRTVVVTGPNGMDELCSNNSTCMVGLHDYLLNNNIQVSPNPTQGNLTISVNDVETRDVRVEVYNVAGEQLNTFVKSEVYNNATFDINLSDLASGMYMIHIITDAGTVVRNVVLK